MADEEADKEPGEGAGALRGKVFIWDSPLPTRVPLRAPSAEEELQLSRGL